MSYQTRTIQKNGKTLTLNFSIHEEDINDYDDELIGDYRVIFPMEEFDYLVEFPSFGDYFSEEDKEYYETHGLALNSADDIIKTIRALIDKPGSEDIYLDIEVSEWNLFWVFHDFGHVDQLVPSSSLSREPYSFPSVSEIEEDQANETGIDLFLELDLRLENLVFAVSNLEKPFYERFKVNSNALTYLCNNLSKK
jgi:hypothetical protein